MLETISPHFGGGFFVSNVYFFAILGYWCKYLWLLTDYYTLCKWAYFFGGAPLFFAVKTLIVVLQGGILCAEQSQTNTGWGSVYSATYWGYQEQPREPPTPAQETEPAKPTN